MLLKNLGVKQEHIYTAADGQQGLAQLHAHRPDIAFVDIRLDKMSGLEMIRCSKAQNLNTTFVLTSAYSEFEYAKEALHLGVKEYLVKPISPADVEALLVQYMPRPTSEENKVYHPMVMRMLATVEEDYAKPISLAKISEELQLTPEYLSYLFRRDMGMNFSTFLRKKRVDHALEMMQNGSTRIYDIAHAVGFSDTKYFCRVFREVTGYSPGHYMKECAGQSE